MEDEPLPPPIIKKPSVGGTRSYDEGIFDSLVTRMNKYKQAAEYCMKVTKDKKSAIRMLDEAEKLNQVATDYKTTQRFEKKLLSPNLTPEILFGITTEDKHA